MISRQQYTIRNIPREVDRRLRDAAHRAHRSLNQTLVAILERAAGVAEPTTYSDLDAFFGSWVADPKTERSLKQQRTIDRRLWR